MEITDDGAATGNFGSVRAIAEMVGRSTEATRQGVCKRWRGKSISR
jgi:hypothetical protein